jgi:putative flippase GtrA
MDRSKLDRARLTPSIAIKSTGIGLIATAVDLLVLATLVEIAGIPAAAANVPALAFGVLAQFLGNKLFAFEDRSSAWAEQGARFFAVEAIAFALNTILFDRLIAWTALPYLVARLGATMLVYFGFSLPLWSRIFRAPIKGVL